MSRAGRKNRFSFAKNRKRLGRGLRQAHNRDPTTPTRAQPGGSAGSFRRVAVCPAAGRWSGQGLPGRAAGTLSQSEVEKSCARVDFFTGKRETPTGSVDFFTAKRRSVPGRVFARFRRAGFRAAVCPAGEKKTGFFFFFSGGPSRMYKEGRASFSEKKGLTFRAKRAIHVSAGRETAQKRQPGDPGGREKPPPEERSPTVKNQTFGLELEVNHLTREAAARAVAGVLSTDGYTATVRHEGGSYDTWVAVDREGRKWRCVSDASIAGGRDQGTEFVTPVCRWEDLETVQACVRALRAAGAHADASCGIHVHVGLGNHTPKTLRNLVNLVNAKEDLLTQALQISPARRDRWCQPVDPDFLATLNRRRPTTSEELARIWYDDRNWEWHAHQHYDPSRYHLLNLHAVWQKGTIEFRAFNSTLHAGEVKAYIQLCLAISHQALTVASASPARPVTDNPAYTFRCWLLRLGMNGEEFKTARTHLLKHLPGNAAWRNGTATTRRAS